MQALEKKIILHHLSHIKAAPTAQMGKAIPIILAEQSWISVHTTSQAKSVFR